MVTNGFIGIHISCRVKYRKLSCPGKKKGGGGGGGWAYNDIAVSWETCPFSVTPKAG